MNGDIKDVGMSAVKDSDPNQSWRNALNFALATHPVDSLRTAVDRLEREQLMLMSKDIPPGLLRLVRRCVDEVTGSDSHGASQRMELMLITVAMLRGKNQEFDVLIEAKEASMGRVYKD